MCLKENRMKQLWKITVFPTEGKSNILELDWLLKIDLAIFTSMFPFSHKVKFHYFVIMSKDGQVRAKLIQMPLNLRIFLL